MSVFSIHRLAFVIAALSLGLICSLGTVGHAEEEVSIVPVAFDSEGSLSADLVQITTPVYQPNLANFRPALGTYTFKIGWQGIPAATAKFATERQGMYYKVRASARTYSGIDIFYKLRYDAEGLLSPLDFSPIRTVIHHRENSRIKNTTISFLENGEVSAIRERPGRPTEQVQFDPRNFMLDPFSAAFLARGLDWTVGETKHFDTFNGKARYLISLECVDKVNLKVNGEDREAWVISPRVKNLTARKDNGKLREARIYITSDERREILKLSSEVFIGSVSAWLVSFEPFIDALPGSAVAKSAAQYYE